MGRGKTMLLAAAFALSFGGIVAAAPLLKLGAEGHDVRIVQEALQKAGYAVEGVTGVFDEATRAAVLAFQRDQRLAESGDVDRETWHALRGVPSPKPAAPAPEPTAPAPAPPLDAALPEVKPPEKAASSPAPAPPSKEAPAPSASASEQNPSERAPSGAGEPAAPTPKERKPAKDAETAAKREAERAAEKVPESAVFFPRKEVPQLVATAKKYLGTPYRFGGTTPKGFDCSGFLQFVFRHHGFSIPRAADEQYHLGQRVKKRQELEPGDLVFFSTYEKGASHCGIYLGKSQFIHVSSSRGVRVDNLDDAYWKPRWYGGKHIVK